MKWLMDNREWLFSGVGVLMLSTVIHLFRRKRATSDSRQTAQAVGGSVLQGGRDVNVTISSGPSEGNSQVEHDRRLFRDSQSLVNHEFLDQTLEHIGADHSHVMSESRRLESFSRFLTSPDSRFISPAIRGDADALAATLKDLLLFLATHFFVYPPTQERGDTRFCMHPGWNIDRDGDGTEEESRKYDHVRDQLFTKLDAVEQAYEKYRGRVREELSI